MLTSHELVELQSDSDRMDNIVASYIEMSNQIQIRSKLRDMNIIEKIFGTHSENELKRIYPIVDKIEALGPEMEALSDEELRGKTREFKERLKEGETLDDILPEAFAVVREGAYRSIGMRHYRVQMIGGIILHQVVSQR